MVWPAIAGGLAAGATGALLGGGSGGGATTAGAYSPDFNVNTGLFRTGLDKTGKQTKNGAVTYKNADIMMQMNPALRALSKDSIAGAGSFLDQAQYDPLSLQAQGLSGLFLDQLGTTDPMEIAQQQYNLLNPILQDQQNQDFLGMEGRLFAQGRLGGSGELSGQSQLNALFDSQADAERKLLFDSLNQGLATQSHLFNMGQGLSGFEQNRRLNNFNLGQGFLNIPLGLQQAMLNQAQVSAGLSGGRALTQGGTGLNPIQTVGAGLLNQGINDVSTGLGGLFQNIGGGANISTPGNFNTFGPHG